MDTHNIKIKLYGEEHNIKGCVDDSILVSAKENGLEPPYSCQMGVCSTCKAKLIEGEVIQESSDSLTEAEKAQNYILTCVSTPKSKEIFINYDE